MSKHQIPSTSRTALKWLPTLFFLVAAGCGGGGDDPAPPQGGTPAPAPAPGPAPAPSPATPTVVDGGVLTAASAVGTATFPEGSSASGGQGNPVNGLPCAPANTTFNQFTHLALYNDGVQLQIPGRAGIVRDANNNLVCVYNVHTHTADHSGRIHVENATPVTYTLGQFFAIWGMPLTTTNVAGITGKTLSMYIIDGGTVSQFTGDPATIELQSHRHIALVLGTPVTELKNYTWVGP